MHVIEYTYTNLDSIAFYKPSLLFLGYKPVQHVTVLNTVGNCNTVVSILVLYYNLMGPPSYMRSVVGRNVVMRRSTNTKGLNARQLVHWTAKMSAFNNENSADKPRDTGFVSARGNRPTAGNGTSRLSTWQQLQKEVQPWCRTSCTAIKLTGYVMHPTGSTFNNCTFCPHCICFVFVSEKTATSAPYVITERFL